MLWKEPFFGRTRIFRSQPDANSFRDKWRKQLNNNIAEKLSKQEVKMSIQDISEDKIMGIRQ